MPASQAKYCVRFTVDTFILIVVVLFVILVKKLWSPFNRGMFCNDQNLTYPYKEDTISDSILLLFGVSVPIVLIFVQEFLRIRRENVGKEIYLFGKRMSNWFWATYTSVGIFLFGCACSQLITDMTKHIIGSLRPHFIEVCKPDWNKTICLRNERAYIEQIPCTADETSDILRDARMSFPSGHASFSAFTMMYLVIYIQARVHIGGFKLIKPLLQLACFILALYTCVTRLSDYAHHWQDVVVGFLIGSSIAVLLAVFVSDLFTTKVPKPHHKNGVMMQQDFTVGNEDLHANHSSTGT